jgi:hypothetical protein
MNTPDDTVQDYREQLPAAPPSHPHQPVAPPYVDPNQAWQHASKRPYVPDDPRRKSPIVAALLSAMPGLGQVYVGYYQHGFVNIIVVGSIIAFLNFSDQRGHSMGGFEPLLGLFLAFFWLYNIIDAGRRAAFYNQALAGLEPGALPDDMKLPAIGGSIFAGVGLIVFGLIVASNTLLGFSLDWFARWWPMALIAAGGYLVARGVRK